MVYISDLTIESFRGINGLELKNLGDINIIVGANNSGKTSILEAIQLLKYPNDIGNAVRVSRIREFFTHIFINNGVTDQFDSFLNMFSKLDKKNKICISTKVKGDFAFLTIEGSLEKKLINISEIMKNQRGGRVWTPLDIDIVNEETECFVGNQTCILENETYDNNFVISRYDRVLPISKKGVFINTEYVSSIDHLVKNNISPIIKAGNKNDIIELLRIFDEKIRGIELLGENRRLIPYIDHKDLGLMPLSSYGDGLKKVLLLASSIVKAKGGVLLIDEIETAIHISALRGIFLWFVGACQHFKVQVFATTHSIEVIDALLKGDMRYYNPNLNTTLSKNNDLLRVITLKKQDTKILVRVLTGAEAYESREEFDMELR